MFAYVQFLVDGVKAIVPISDIKNFNYEETIAIDFNRAHEVFWKSPSGEGSGFYYAVVLLVEKTKELIECREKRIKLPTQKMLEDLLQMTLADQSKSIDEESRRKNKETQEKRSAYEKQKLNEILKLKKKENKRTLSPDDERREAFNLKPNKKCKKPSLSPSESSDGDELVLKSELKRITAEYEKVQRRLKLKQEENLLLKKRNDELQELNISLQTQLLSLLGANGSLDQNPPETQLPVINSIPKRVPTTEGGRLAQNPLETHLPVIKSSKERVPTTEEGLGCIPPSQELQKAEISIKELGDNNVEVETTISAPTLEKSKPTGFDGLYLHDNGSLMQWKDEQMELAPSVLINKTQWCKILSTKNMNESRFTRNLAVSLWGSETLKERSVTGAICKRYLKDGVDAKKALTPIKVDAVQNGLRFWLMTEGGNREKSEIMKMSSTVAVRKMLSDKIMDLNRQAKKKT